MIVAEIGLTFLANAKMNIIILCGFESAILKAMLNSSFWHASNTSATSE